jgi:DNA-3-methyladenine glycosylase
MAAIIDSEWFDRSAVEVAPDLIGCTLVRQLSNTQELRGMIVETEAYQKGDPACHAYRKLTERNQVMFGPPGYVYVYLIYGMYYCVNVVTDRQGTASAVLIRALELDIKTLNTVSLKPKEKLERVAAGPGKLCRALQIDLNLYGTKLEQNQALLIEHRSLDWQTMLEIDRPKLVQTTRIGLIQGVELPWRWYLKDCPAVSKQ